MKMYENGSKIDYFFKPIPFELSQSARVVANYPVDFSVKYAGSEYFSSFSVFICKENNNLSYTVREPYLEEEARRVFAEYMEKLDFLIPPSEAVKIDPIGYFLSYVERRMGFAWLRKYIEPAKYYLIRDILGYWIVDPFMRDGQIEDISCDSHSRPVRVWHRKYNSHGWMETNVVFQDEDELDSALLRIVHRAGKSISIFSPVLDTVMHEGYRIAATLGREVSGHGSSFTIRKQRSSPFTMAELIRSGTIAPELAAYLWMILNSKGFIFICGPPASGKTTLLNSLVGLLPPSWKIVTIEDTPEVSLPQRGWKSLHTRNTPSEAPVGLFELVKLSLRERPDFVVLGETRGEEAQALFQSALAGSGCISTFHAPDYESMRARLTEPPINVSESLLGMIDCAVFLSIEGGRRKVRIVVEFCDEPNIIFYQQNYGVTEIISRSRKLQKRYEPLGFNSSRLEAEFRRRVDFLERMVGSGISTMVSQSEYLQRFYSSF